MLTKSQREELFHSVDLRALTGRPVPRRANDAVRVDCPVHGGKNDLAIFPDHAYCFSAKCGWTGRAFDVAAILLGYYDKQDPMWPSKCFKPVMETLQRLKAGYVKPLMVRQEPPTEAQLEDLWVGARHNTEIEDLKRVDRWRGWPEGTANEYKLALTTTAIMIPVFNSKERLVSIRYRIRPKLESKERPKYWGVSGANDAHIMFGGNNLPKNTGKVLVLVEGEFDTISSQLAGVPTLNFINGAGWKDGREVIIAALLRRFERVLVAYDQDEAGYEGASALANNAMRLPDILRGRVMPVTWNADLGKDPNEFVKKQGVAAWRTLIKEAL
jgi:hypothetical protein